MGLRLPLRSLGFEERMSHLAYDCRAYKRRVAARAEAMRHGRCPCGHRLARRWFVDLCYCGCYVTKGNK